MPGLLSNSHTVTKLPAQDLERARAFYRDKLGLEPVSECRLVLFFPPQRKGSPHQISSSFTNLSQFPKSGVTSFPCRTYPLCMPESPFYKESGLKCKKSPEQVKHENTRVY